MYQILISGVDSIICLIFLANKLIFSLINEISIFKYDGDLDIFLSFGRTFFTLSLFFKDGQYDDSILFVNKTNNGVKWSKNLFNYYVKKSLKVL